MNNEYLNTLIKADDLYWNEEEQKYVALSNEEIDTIIQSLLVDENNEIKNMSIEDVESIIQWATETRVAYLLLQGILAKRIITDYTPGKELLFFERA